MFDYATSSEQELVKRAKHQDAHAFAMLYKSVYIDLYKFALYTLKHPQDAEDAVSETVVAAFENIYKLRRAEAFRGWMFRILTNKCKKKLMDTKSKTLEIQEEDIIQEESLAESKDVRDAFGTLEVEERVIIALSVFAGYSSKEIGEMLHLNSNTVRSKRSRALEKLSQRLKI